MDSLASLDTQVFLMLNHLPHVPLLELPAKVLSGIGRAGIVWFVLAAVLFLREEKKNHWFFVPLVLVAAGSEIIVNLILKPLVSRARPAADLGAIVIGNHDGFSFPSGHATIAFAMAVVLSKIEPTWRPIFYLLAIAISFSRIYLGQHFPLDVVAGAALGFGIGQLALLVSQKLKRSLTS